MQAKYNVMEVLAYLGPFTFAFLAAGAYVFEWDQGLSTEVGSSWARAGRQTRGSWWPAGEAFRAACAAGGEPRVLGRDVRLPARGCRACGWCVSARATSWWPAASVSWSTCSATWPSNTCRQPPSKWLVGGWKQAQGGGERRGMGRLDEAQAGAASRGHACVGLDILSAVAPAVAATSRCAGCLKNVLVVWGGILQGDVVTRQELQVRCSPCSA